VYPINRRTHPQSGGPETVLNPDVAQGLKIIERTGILRFVNGLECRERWMRERIGDGCSGLPRFCPQWMTAGSALRLHRYEGTAHPIYQKADADFREFSSLTSRGFRIATRFFSRSGIPRSPGLPLRSGIQCAYLALPGKELVGLWPTRGELPGDWAGRHPQAGTDMFVFRFNILVSRMWPSGHGGWGPSTQPATGMTRR